MTRPTIGVNGVRLYEALPLKTGQTTQYSSELDDGYYQTGIAKSYNVLTTGQYSGTTNVDLIHYAAALSFDAASKEIRDAANGLALFKDADVIVVTGSTSNDGTYTVATGNVAAKIVVTEAIGDEAAGGAVSIAKRESKSNNCVMDNNTGLMWMRDASNYPAKMGLASDGKMPVTAVAYDIFAYCAACNAAMVGGYADWRVPNINEFRGLLTVEPIGTISGVDPTAFANHPTTTLYYHSSTAMPASPTAYVLGVYSGHTASPIVPKGIAYYTMLVRGGR
jgi:hypothetical protein